MNLTLEHTEIFENTESGEVLEQFRFSGGQFKAGDETVELATFDLQLLRDEDDYLDAVLIEIDPVSADLWRTLAKVLPLDPQAIPADHVGKILLEFDPDLLESLAPYLADIEGLEDMLCLADEDEELFFFNFANYQPSDAASGPQE